jgi:redox-sensitive bicupin YhaK (pirin superfamily)
MRRPLAGPSSDSIAAGMTINVDREMQVLTADRFHRLGAAEFGMPSLLAIESVGPFVELARLGPFITIHDSFLAPGLGIGHHPHRSNERLFYILRGEIHHDDALNGIQGVMHEGDLARLTEGERGMLHREWNGRDDITTHAFILVYTPDVDPPIPTASFEALRAGDVVRSVEAQGVETLQLIGGGSRYRANSSAITVFSDTTLAPNASLELTMPQQEGLFLYPLDGTLRIDGVEDPMRGGGIDREDGPNAAAIAWSGDESRSLRLEAVDGPARLLRIGFARGGPDDLVLHRPWRRP